MPSDDDEQAAFDNADCLGMKLALLQCACQSYRYESAARPFPPQFRGDAAASISRDNCADGSASVVATAKDIDELRRLLDACCSGQGLDEFFEASSESEPVDCGMMKDRTPAGMRRWLSANALGYRLQRRLPLEAAFAAVCRGVSSDVAAGNSGLSPPSLVYSVEYSDRVERRFAERRAGRQTFYGYHGSRSDNMHSILANGLHAHLSFGRQPLYGEGVYLSTDLGVALTFAQAGAARPLGDRVQCVVVGEIIDDPGLVRHRRKPTWQRQAEGQVVRNVADDEDTDRDFPAEYFVVKSSELVIVRHLLVFSAGDPIELRRPSGPRSFSSSSSSSSSSRATISMATARFVRRHGAWLAIFGYVLLLLLPRIYAWLAAAVAKRNGEAEVAGAMTGAAGDSEGGGGGGGGEALGSWGVRWD